MSVTRSHGVTGLRVARRCMAALCLALATASVGAQETAREVVPLWPSAPPGTESWTGGETQTVLQVPGMGSVRMVGNVTRPTLTVYRPDPAKANGTAVIVAPGGGFQLLAMEHEGDRVARWLAARGVTAFLLKYRVHMIPGFRMAIDVRRHPERFAEFAALLEPWRRIAVADATQAIRHIRARTDSYAVAPDRVGMIGFSAGALTTMGVVLNDAAQDRPNFAAPIYGAMSNAAPSPGSPPLFIAVAQDDDAVPAPESLAIYSRWSAAGLPAELHVYERGGHGFGLTDRGLPVDRWIVAFETWMGSHGWLTKPPRP